MIEHFIDTETLQELRRRLVQDTDEWTHRGQFLICDDLEFGHVDKEDTARLIVMLHTYTLPIVNEVWRLRKIKGDLEKQLREVISTHPYYARRRPHANH
jgi:hypothetical protein